MAALDAIICAIICYGLRRTHKATGLGTTTPLGRYVYRIMAYTLTTSLLTTIVVGSGAVLLKTPPVGARWSILPGYTVVMIYLLSMLFTINAKYRMRELTGDVKSVNSVKLDNSVRTGDKSTNDGSVQDPRTSARFCLSDARSRARLIERPPSRITSVSDLYR